MRRAKLAVMIGFLLGSTASICPPLAAQDTVDVGAVLDLAREAFDKNEFRRSIAQLQRAIGLIQSKMMEQLQQYFPKPFGDWQEMKSQDANTTLSSNNSFAAKKLYYHQKTSGSIEIEFAFDRTKAANLQTWIANPLQMRSSSQNAEIETIAGKRFITEFDKKGKHGELSMVLNSAAVVRFIGDGIKDLDDLRRFAERVNYETLREILR